MRACGRQWAHCAGRQRLHVCTRMYEARRAGEEEGRSGRGGGRTGRNDRGEEIGGGGRIGRASFGHIDRLMIARNKGQTVTWSRGRVMDRFRRGGGPRERAAAFNPGGTGEATGCAADRPADDTHQSAGNGTTRCTCPRCYSAAPRRRARPGQRV